MEPGIEFLRFRSRWGKSLFLQPGNILRSHLQSGCGHCSRYHYCCVISLTVSPQPRVGILEAWSSARLREIGFFGFLCWSFVV